ncbi:carboxypeptidase-like regulatory domain-containing protein [Leptospira sp. WS39.C2]
MNFIFLHLRSHFKQNVSKGMLLLLVPFLFLQNCYLNPFVYDLLNPVEKEEDSAFLSLLGLGPSSFIVTGQLISLGSVVSGATVKIADSTDITNQSITDSAGRFKLIGSAGNMTLEVDHLGTVFRIGLSVTPPIVTLNSISNSSYSVISLEAYSSILGDISFLDLTSSNPYNGLNVTDNTIYSATIGNDFLFVFSDNLEIPSDADAWRATNFIFTPSINFYSTAVSGNQAQIQVDTGSYMFGTYTLTLMPGIKSTSGNSLRATVIQFQINHLP